MRRLMLCWVFLAVVASGMSSVARAQLVINEILFNPPFGDLTNEFIELRGTPNYRIPDDTYLVGVEGDGEENPGLIQNVFDLAGRRLGQNGFLVMFQKAHRFRSVLHSASVTNSDSGLGWGSGSSSSVDHSGENGQGEIENPSVTFFLIQSAVKPHVGDDIDTNNVGTINFSNALAWVVLDAVGVLDNGGAGDVAYGRINFRRDTDPGSQAFATNVVPVSFTPGYVGRNGNTEGWTTNDWVASDNLLGRPPNFYLGNVSTSTTVGTNTFPVGRKKAALNHAGGPNFGAPAIPSVVVLESKTNTVVSEAGLKDYYTVGLSLRPTGAVTLRITAQVPAQVSVDGGKTFASVATLPLLSISPKKILVRALDDGLAGPAELLAMISHAIVSSIDQRYSNTLEILPVVAKVLDTNVVLLSEVKVNPPGEDAPYEFVELRGPPGRMITNLHLLAIQGDQAQNPGLVTLAVDLNSQSFGSNGLLMVAAPGQTNCFSPATSVVATPAFTNLGGTLNNGSFSLLLVGSRQSVVAGVDLDAGDNGTLEGLAEDATIVDAIAWSDGGNDDVIYGGVDLSQRRFTPDAATRLPFASERKTASAWIVGDLIGSTGDSLSYDSGSISTNVAPGAVMTPGVVNRRGPRMTPSPITPITAVVGRSDNETLEFSLSVLRNDAANFKATVSESDFIPATVLNVTVSSTNQAVVPDANLSLTNIALGRWRLNIVPVGVGYSDIIIRATDGIYTTLGFLHYAASEEGRLGAVWHPHVSDASAAVPIDANWMFVGDDENQTIRLFSRTRSGPPVAGRDFSIALSLRDYYEPDSPLFPEPREVDIEGATRVGNRIYWMGSHSHAFNATERTNRGRIFATDISGSGTNAQLKLLAHYDFLKLDLIDWDANNVHGKGANYYGFAASAAEGTNPKAPDGSGFNLEGLCMAPGPNNTTNCYIAFRAPLVPATNRVHALILPVLNYGRITTKSSGPGSAKFGAPIELNLGGRAVRSIEGYGGTNYLIIAGPPGAPDTNGYVPPPGNFRLFTWNGQATNQPAERAADMSQLNAEGIVEVPAGVWGPTNTFQILSDNGTNIFYGDGIQAKHLQLNRLPREFKKFRVDTITLGEVVTPTPVIRTVSASEGVITITWFSVAGMTYRLQMRATVEADWSDVVGDVVATGATTSRSITAPGPDTQCFFRVVVVP